MLPGITWEGALLAVVVQVLLVAAAVRAARGQAGDVRAVALRVLAADLLLFPLLLAIESVGRRYSVGPIRHRIFMTFQQDVVACTAAWVVWSVALYRSPLRRAGVLRGVLLGLGLALSTFVGLLLPGLRLPWFRSPVPVNHIVVTLPRLPKALEGVRILFISDTHVGPGMSPRVLQQVLEPVRREQVDLVVFGGDLASYHLVQDHPTRIAQSAAVLDAICPHVPRAAVLGNHDVDTNAQLVTDALTKRGFVVLRNTSRRVRVRGQEIWLAGVDFSYSQEPQLPQTLARVPEGAFTVLLAHTPDIVREPLTKRVDLILSGHTHGGQIVLPALGPVDCNSRFGARYASGLLRLGDTRLFVTRGVGTVPPPWRVLCDPEVDVLELHGGAGGPD